MLRRRFSARLIGAWAALAVFAAVALPAQDVPILQPGAPGEATVEIGAEEAVRTADTRFTPDDARFMQDMISHHRQAVEMAALVEGRTNNQALIDAARRIDASQADEIAFMQSWLRERGQEAPDPGAHAGHRGGAAAAPGHGRIEGMATPEQMAALAAASGTDFDRLFLQRMIAHHEGAITMVRNLREQPGSARDPLLSGFLDDVRNEQQGEIDRMGVILLSLSHDPRSSLEPGLADAGQASRNLRLVASLPKPTGFFDPDNPAGLPAEAPVAEGEAATEGGDAPAQGGRAREPRPRLELASTDMAFSGDLLVVGGYHGFNLYRLVEGRPRLVSSVICPGGQGDVSIVGDLLIVSVEETRARVDCGRQGVSGDASPERFRGLRIFDIADPLRPVQVGQVQTCRGSHTHSVVSGPGEAGTIVVYNSGTSSVRPEEELAGCIGAVPGDERTALFRIDVVEIPVADPSRARIVDSPAVFADPESGRLGGLWLGGGHGEATQETSRTDQCHDITVFPARDLAAGACSGNGIIFDIGDPRRPRRIDAVVDPSFAYWHSATFNNDGTKVLFTDEWGGGLRPRCRAQDPHTWGGNAIYDIVEGRLQFRSHFKLPGAQGRLENCVAHNGSIIPVPGRDVLVQAWYQGGLSVIDFTDSANPAEIAWFDRGPIDDEHLVLGGFWSAYWYDGYIYASEIVRGLDVLALEPSEYLTANEIEAAALAEQGGRFNAQQQFPVAWPDHPVVALAYLDQLRRSRTFDPEAADALAAALEEARPAVEADRSDSRLAVRIASLAAAMPEGGDAAAARRLAALRETLSGIAARLR